MNREGLFEAIGMMDEGFLEDSLTVQEAKPRRIVWKTVLAAAIIASLAVSVVAAVVTELYGRTGKVQEEFVERWGTERVEVHTGRLDIYVIFPELRNTPNEIRDFYAPTIYEKEKLVQCYVNEGEKVREFCIGWNLSKAGGVESGGAVWLNQWCCDDYDPSQPVDSLIGTAFTELDHTSETILHNGREYFFLCVEPFTDEYTGDVYDNHHYLYWTDGSYIFRLNFPNCMDVERAFEIVDSVERISNVEGWLELGKMISEEFSVKRWEKYVQKLSSEEPYAEIKSLVSADTEVLEEGDLKVSIQMLPMKEGTQFNKRLVYPRVFDGVKIDRLGFVTSDADQETEEYEVVDYSACWKTEEYGGGEEIWYSQKWRRNSLYFSSASYEFFIFDMEDPEQIRSRTVQWGEDTLFEVSFEKGKDGAAGAKYYFWGDAHNVFSLRVPYAMEETTVKEILDSIR